MKPKKKSNTDYIVYAIIFVFVVFCALHLAMAYDWAVQNPVIETRYEGTVSEVTEEKFNIMGLLETWGMSLSETPFDISFNDYTPKVVLISVFLFLLIVAYMATTKRKYISGKEHGTAEWGEPTQLSKLGWQQVKKLMITRAKEDLKKSTQLLEKDKSITSFERRNLIKEKEVKTEKKIENFEKNIAKNTEIILAEGVKFSIYNQEINSNVMIYGGSGAGKSRGIVMPNILNLAGTCSFVVTDPKGEIYQKSRYFLQNVMGYKVRCINLFEKYKSSHYNPLHYIHVDRENYDWQEDVLTLIDTMIINLDGGEGKKGSDPFWDDSARHFIQSLFFFTMYMCEPQDRNMNQIMWLLGQLEIGEEEDNYDSPLDQLFELLKSVHGEENIAYRTYKDFRTKASGKTAKSIAMTMVAKLQPYNIASVQAISEYDEMLLDRIGEEKTALFVIVPPSSKTFNFVAGMLFTQTFQELNYCANALHGGRLPVPVQFILDEFANTCVLPNFEQIIAYARSLGIGIMPILQSRSQLKGMYEKAWETISDNCASTVFLGSINSEDTLKAFSDRLGEGTFDEKDVSVSKGRSSSTSTSNKKIGRKLMNPDEIASMPKTDCLVFISGYKPMYCKKFNYPKHENYKHTSDFDDRYLTMFVPDEPAGNPYDRPHGEDELTVAQKVEMVMKDIEKDLPTMTTEPEAVLDMINSTYLGNWDIEPNYLLDEDVYSIMEDKAIEEELQKSREDTINTYASNIEAIWKDIEKDLPTMTTEPEAVLELVEDMASHIEEVDIVENFELDDEAYEMIDDLLDSVKSLSEEMSQVEQMQNTDVDISMLAYSTDDEEEYEEE